MHKIHPAIQRYLGRSIKNDEWIEKNQYTKDNVLISFGQKHNCNENRTFKITQTLKYISLVDLFGPSRLLNPGGWIYRQRLYHVAVKAASYRKAVDMYYIVPRPCDILNFLAQESHEMRK